jgi:D-beta-D-heptose 7-phosphate kinase/D-beta-D-heptose 1-phosphate adenosyltransferase
MIGPAQARKLVQGFTSCRVLVVGDLMLDRYVWGSVDRISPEAPVPVVQVQRESTMLGGAGNVVRNLVSLGAQVDVVALVGDDESATELRRLLDHWKIDPSGLIVDASRPTTEKTRVIAGSQQVVRYDRESDEPLLPAATESLLGAVRARATRVDGVIVEDYGKGLLEPGVAREVMAEFGRNERRVFVDPKLQPWDVYRGAELLKPNLREAQEVSGIKLRREADLEAMGRALLAQTGAQTVAITRGAEGMTLFPSDGPTEHVATVRREVADQAGAGDTAIAALTLARLAGASWREAASLANAAAGVVVAIPGTATLSPADLLRSVESAA